jgi:hypothetical protein
VVWGRDAILYAREVHFSGNSLVLGSEVFLPWAIYSVGDLCPENELTAVAVDFEETTAYTGDGTALYIAVANYSRGVWEWFDPVDSPWEHALDTPVDYRSAEGEAHVAVVLAGPGEGRIETVTFSSSGDLVGPPENLTAQINDELAGELDWDDGLYADGYNVFRATETDLDDAQQLNAELMPDSDYLDAIAPSSRGKYYFYYVTAVGLNESDPSNVARVWSPQVNLPAPENLRLGTTGTDSFAVEWDWSYPEPTGGFMLFIDTEPDFIIDASTENHAIYGYKPRNITIDNRKAGTQYYIKMCARTTSGDLGRMTAEIQARLGGFWDWDEVYTIEAGEPPIRAIIVDGQFAVVFVSDTNIRFALGADESWEIETVLGPDCGWYVDIAYGGGTYLIAAMELDSGDAWAATGLPGDWSSERIHGNGYTGLGHPESGYCIAAGASETEFAVAHQALPMINDPQEPGLILHTRPISGETWTTDIIRVPEPDNELSTCFTWVGENLLVLSADLRMTEVLGGDRDGAWSWQDIRQDDSLYVPRHYDLHILSDEYYTTAFDPGNKELYIAHGNARPWAYDMIAGEGGQDLGHYARLAVEGNEAVAVFYGEGYYHFALFSESWQHHTIYVPDVQASEYGPYADVTLLDGVPYFFFHDEGDAKIKVAKGTPPVF